MHEITKKAIHIFSMLQNIYVSMIITFSFSNNYHYSFIITYYSIHYHYTQVNSEEDW